MEEDQLELRRPDQIAGTDRNLERMRKAGQKPAPTLQELSKLRAEVKARSDSDEVLIVELDGPMQLWTWLCKKHREDLRPGWYVKSTKAGPHPLVCDKCRRGAK